MGQLTDKSAVKFIYGATKSIVSALDPNAIVFVTEGDSKGIYVNNIKFADVSDAEIATIKQIIDNLKGDGYDGLEKKPTLASIKTEIEALKASQGDKAAIESLTNKIEGKQDKIEFGDEFELKGKRLTLKLDTALFKVVDEPASFDPKTSLPIEGDENKIHLVKYTAEESKAAEDNNRYIEYIWIHNTSTPREGKWEKFGEYYAKLSDYVTKEDLKKELDTRLGKDLENVTAKIDSKIQEQPKASTEQFGIVKIGNGISVSDGTISVQPIQWEIDKPE